MDDGRRNRFGLRVVVDGRDVWPPPDDEVHRTQLVVTNASAVDALLPQDLSRPVYRHSFPVASDAFAAFDGFWDDVAADGHEVRILHSCGEALEPEPVGWRICPRCRETLFVVAGDEDGRMDLSGAYETRGSG